MGAISIVLIILCVIVTTYLYVMGLCYLCDVYEQRKLAKRDAEEKRRKEELQRAIAETEMRRQTEVERRKRSAEERRQRGRIAANGASHMPARP
jgi:predicted Holliday junction resolvase-like endonuclease